MRSRIRRRGTFVVGVLVLGCALIGGWLAHAVSAQERKDERPPQPRPAVTQPSESGQKPRDEPGPAGPGQAAAKEAHVPEIDGASIPTALALLGASVLMLRARLRSK